MLSTTRERLFSKISAATCRAFREAEIRLPLDVVSALEVAANRETHPLAEKELRNILENIRLAEKLGVPICQDTGVPICYVTLPPDIPYTASLIEAIGEGVKRATATVPLRPNVVDPCTRQNTATNTGHLMPYIHVRPGMHFTITVLPKGAGSENVSRIGMLLPSDREKIEQFVVETVLIAGGRPCPPVILGVGIGSTFDGVATLAKEALLAPVDVMDSYEQKLCDKVNLLKIGPMGLGGDITALAVKVKTGDCHLAMLPVAVNVQCWADRRATREVVW
jgi:fumarate hydratase subunit alpha